jgi:sulfite exporter TauE/SafE
MLIDFSSIGDNSASLLVIFLYGIMTSFHCISMCGGIILTGSLSISDGSIDKSKNVKPMAHYNAGRVIAYTIFGAVAGGLGSLIALTGFLKGLLPLITGILMVIMGLNFIGALKKIKVSSIFNRIFKNKVYESKLFKDKSKNMFIVGLVTGLFPCGPMQAIQLYSLATANVVKGAVVMFIFAIGTVPILFLFGVLSSLLNAKFTKIALKLSSVILIIMGLFMVNRGLALWEIKIDPLSIFSNNDKVITATVRDNEQTLITEFTDEEFPHLAFKKGIPVKWIINMDEKYVGECKATIEIDEYDIKVELNAGENIITFTPEEEKEIGYNSWCGMLSNKITIYSEGSE